MVICGYFKGHELADIFISYSRADRKRVEKLANAFEASGYTVWWDRNIQGGAQFAAEIERQLNQAKAVVVVWSKQSVGSEWVLDEAGQAREDDKLVPITLDEIMPPLGFRQRQAVDFSRWNNAIDAPEFESLTTAISEFKNGATKSAPIQKAPQITSNKLLTFGGLAALVVLVAVAIIVLRPVTPPDAVSDEAVEALRSDAVGLAVLPFANISNDIDKEYFVDGLTEELLNWLANVEGLNVPGRTTAFSFKGKAEDLRLIGQRLGVQYILEGSVRYVDQSLRISAQLVEVKSGFNIWSETYDRTLSDIFSIQEDVAFDVITEILGEIPATAMKNPSMLEGVDARAHELFLEGRALWSARQGSAALEKFREAVRVDAKHWLAQAYISIVVSNMLHNGVTPILDGEDLRVVASDALSKATEMRPDQADVLFAQGWVLEQLNVKSGRITGETAPVDLRIFEFYEKALRANPRHYEAMHALGRLASRDGDFEKYEMLLTRVLEIDPGHVSARINLANHYLRRDNVAEATSLMREGKHFFSIDSLAVHSDFYRTAGNIDERSAVILGDLGSASLDHSIYRRRANALADLGQRAGAVLFFEKAAAIEASPLRAAWAMSLGAEVLGESQTRLKLIESVIDEDGAPFWFISAYARALIDNGESQRALDELIKVRPNILNPDQLKFQFSRFESLVDFEAVAGALALRELGREKEAESIWKNAMMAFETQNFDTGSLTGWRRPMARAIIQANLGNSDEAFQELESAYDQGFRFLYSYYCGGCLSNDFYSASGLFGPIYEDARFRAYVDKIEKENAGIFAEIDHQYNITSTLKTLTGSKIPK